MKIVKVIIFQVIVFFSNLIAQEIPDQNDFNVGQFVRGAITLKVIGEDSNPIENAKIHIVFQNTTEYLSGENNFHGKSDDKGLFYAESNMTGVITINVEKEGYYRSSMMYQFPSDENMGIQPGEKLSPWNPTIPIILKKIGNPIPMIVRRYDAELRVGDIAPSLGDEYEWDLILADWLPPNGTGETGDLVFRFEGTFESNTDYFVKMNIRYGNPNDGMIRVDNLTGTESQLKFPRTAPVVGYDGEARTYQYRVEDGGIVKYPETPPAGYIIRFRTILDEQGEVLSAYYGRINTPIEIMPTGRPSGLYSGRPGFRFESYLNPTPNDRNLEYDGQTNLASEWERRYFAAPP